MKILHIANHCRFGHGNVHAAVDLACAQVENGHDVWFASGGGEFESLLASHGVQHLHVPQERRKPLSLVQSTYKLHQHVSRLKLDIVHAHMMTGAMLAYPVTRKASVRLITTVHNAFDRHSIIMGCGDRVIAVSRSVMGTMNKRGVRFAKLHTVLNGTLNVARRNKMSHSPAPLMRPSISTVCGLHHRKGVHDLIEAFVIVAKQNTEAHLYIIGEGPSEQSYKEQAEASGHADRIHFLGQLRDPNPQLLATDIFVLASYHDPCPLVISEALEAGCAIVASDVDGIPEMLSICEAGTLFTPGDHKAIADALLHLLENEGDLAAQKAASHRRIDYFDIDRVYRETQEVYSGQ